MLKTWMKVALILLALGGFGAWVLMSENERQARMTAETSAILTKVTLDEDEESSSLDETDVEYQFTAGGQRVSGADSLPGDYTDRMKVGQKVRLCYNPKETSESDLELGDARCGA
jgi:hypothetical protein